MQLFVSANPAHGPAYTRTRLFRYASAFGLVAVALLFTLVLPDIRYGTPFLFFFLAVVLSAVLGGIGPGLLALVLTVGAVVMWVRPSGDLLRTTRWQPVQTVAFVVVMVTIILLLEALRRSQARYYSEREWLRMTLASIGDATIATDAAGKITWMNDVATRLTGWPAHQTLGLPIEAVYQTASIDTRAPLTNLVYAVLDIQQAVNRNGPLLLIARDGHESFVESTAAPIRNTTGDTVGTILVFRDITERYQAAERLRAIEERFRIAQEISLDGFMILEAVREADGIIADFRWQYLNPAAARLLGNSREWFADRLVLEVLLGIKQKSDLFAVLAAIVETGEPRNIEIFYDADGIHGWFRSMIVKLEDGIAVSFSDITERKQRERELNYQAFILANVSDAIYVIDRDLNIRLWNKGAEALYGWKAEEVVGRNAAGVVRPISPPEATAAGMTAAEPGERRSFDEVHHNRRDEEVYIDSVATTLREDDGSVIGFAVIDHNVTERKRHEQQLLQINASLEDRIRERTAELERSNRELDRFAYVASHDLKAPLRAVANLAGWIEEDAAATLPTASRTHLAKLQTRIKRMDRLLDDLLVYSRAGRVRHQVELVDLHLLVQTTVEFLSLPPSFTVDVPVRLPVIYSERIPLETVFRNLIQNAYKHHHQPTSGHVRITAEELGDTVQFQVADDGPGIAPQYQERVFEIFQTLKPRDQVEGSGIGLTVVKKIVESRGGSLRLESAVGAGSTFIIHWPTPQVTHESKIGGDLPASPNE